MKIIHLYWAYNRPEWVKSFKQLTIGYSVCGLKLERKFLTRFTDDNECEDCKKTSRPKREIARRRFTIERRQLKL